MKKRLITAIMALCMVLSLSGTALANSQPEHMPTTNSEETIPVLGYLGEDTSVIDPEEPPTGEIYVEVPTQIMFAAFESGGGAVSSPKFTITNLSENNAVKVEIAQFTQRNAHDVNLDGKLSLGLVNHQNEPLMADLFPADYTSPKLLAARLPKAAGTGDNVIGFMVGGTWTGDFTENLHPEFDMTLKFSVTE